jgi:hypothetical protein
MGTYILRRLLLMIPTLIGITFLIFMLMALAPGGIGASLQISSGGQTDQTSAAVQKAYLEDRYGLDDPAVVQYVRWLGRISPVKFGERDQYAPDGERLSLPKAIKAPPMWAWFIDELPAPPETTFAWPEDEWAAKGLDAEGIAKAKESIFRGISNETARGPLGLHRRHCRLSDGRGAVRRLARGRAPGHHEPRGQDPRRPAGPPRPRSQRARAGPRFRPRAKP